MQKLKKILPGIIVIICFVIICNITLKQANSSVIDRVDPIEIIVGEKFYETEGVSTLGVYGSKFQLGDIIYLNNQPQDTTFGNEGWLTCFVPDEFYEKQGRVQVQVKRIDDKGKIIEKSNIKVIRILAK